MVRGPCVVSGNFICAMSLMFGVLCSFCVVITYKYDVIAKHQNFVKV